MKAKTGIIYGLTEIGPEPNWVRYVGKSIDGDRRLNDHRNPKPGDDTPRAKWIRQVKNRGRDIDMVILGRFPISEIDKWEETYISLLNSNGAKLLNVMHGKKEFSGFPTTPKPRVSPAPMPVARHRYPPRPTKFHTLAAWIAGMVSVAVVAAILFGFVFTCALC